MSFTYNPDSGAVRDDVRLLITDTDPDRAIFSDEELNALLRLATGIADATGIASAYAAAALAYETWARDRAKLAKLRQFGDERTEQRAIADLLALADALRSASSGGEAVAIGQIIADGARKDYYGNNITPQDPRYVPGYPAGPYGPGGIE